MAETRLTEHVWAIDGEYVYVQGPLHYDAAQTVALPSIHALVAALTEELRQSEERAERAEALSGQLYDVLEEIDSRGDYIVTMAPWTERFLAALDAFRSYRREHAPDGGQEVEDDG